MPADPALSPPIALSPPVALPLPIAPSAPSAPIPPERLLRATAGMAVLGVVSSLSEIPAEVLSPTAASLPFLAAPLLAGLEAGLVPVIGTGVLTAPALVVAHQYLSLSAEPRELLRDLADTYCRVGDLALGLIPVIGLFVLTTDIAPLLFGLLYLLSGALGLCLAVLRLERTERLAGNPGTGFKMLSLGMGWAALAGLIALRLCVGPLLALL